MGERISLAEFQARIASGAIEVWCYCFDTTEPIGPWTFPDDEHADTCGFDLAPTRTDAGNG